MIELKLNPDNPRTINSDKFEELRTSILNFSQMLDVRPIVYDETKTILGGNQRYLALLQLDQEGRIEVKDGWFVEAVGWTDAMKSEFIIKDNANWGRWDYDMLANRWDHLPLREWGIETIDWTPNEMPKFGQNEVTDDEVEKKAKELLGRMVKDMKNLMVICPQCRHEFEVGIDLGNGKEKS